MAARIVSLLPSATEIVCILGLEDSLAGVSHECDFPPRVRRLPEVVRSSFNPATLSQSENRRESPRRHADRGKRLRN